MFSFFTQYKTPKQEREERQQRVKDHQHRAVPWDLWKTKPPTRLREPLVILGETYSIDHKLFDVRPTTDPFDNHIGTFVEYGDFRYRHLRLPAGEPLPIPKRDRDESPEVFFTTPIVAPVLHQHNTEPWRKGWTVWMGLTPAEIFSQRSGIRFCRGNVVIGGLGLGWFLSEVVKRSAVDKVTVVEKSRDLLDWYGDSLCAKYGADVVCDDIWNVVGKFPDDTRYAIDIWKDFFDADGDRSLVQARAQGHHIWAWGSARG